VAVCEHLIEIYWAQGVKIAQKAIVIQCDVLLVESKLSFDAIWLLLVVDFEDFVEC